MASCEFNDTCHFLNKKVIEMPLTTFNAVNNFCHGDFTICTIHKIAMTHGIKEVPKYVSPDDQYELSSRVIELVHRSRLGC
jgi:hypothetical protein